VVQLVDPNEVNELDLPPRPHRRSRPGAPICCCSWAQPLPRHRPCGFFSEWRHFRAPSSTWATR